MTEFKLSAKVTLADKEEPTGEATRLAIQMIIEDRLTRLRGLRFKVSEVKVE